MTGPTDGDDWDFPEVEPGPGPAVEPTSLELPEPPPEPEPPTVYDTGSDAWWRAQAAAQREAAADEHDSPRGEPVAQPEPAAPSDPELRRAARAGRTAGTPPDEPARP